MGVHRERNGVSEGAMAGNGRRSRARLAGLRRRLPGTAALRLGSGLVLFAYATMHLLNHALGTISLDALEFGADIKRAVWSGPIGLTAL